MLQGPFVVSSCNDRVAVWDVASGHCACVLQVDRGISDDEMDAQLPFYSRAPPLWGVPNPFQFGADVLGSFGKSSDSNGAHARASHTHTRTHAILNTPYSPQIFTGGEDLSIRMWDVETPSRSSCIATPDLDMSRSGGGLDTEASLDNWTMMGDFVAREHDGVGVIRQMPTTSTADRKARLTTGRRLSLSASMSASASEIPAPALGTDPIGSLTGVPSKEHQAGLLSTSSPVHRESVTDLAMLEIPYPLLVSAGRDGVVKCWS